MHTFGSGTVAPTSLRNLKKLFYSIAVLTISTAVYAGSPVTWYVDFANTGLESGSVSKPFNTLDEALNKATSGDTVVFSTNNASHETPTINQAVTLDASGGTASIGVTASPFGSGTPYEAIKITELMFNPASGKAEFLEIQNTSSSAVDMSGVEFNDGITYLFPGSSTIAAGAYIVLVRDVDQTQFVADYPASTVFGIYSGNLDNGGERLAMEDPSNVTFYELTYSDGASWPDLADGVGFSMVINDPFGDGDSGSNWRASNADGGNPGSVDINLNTAGILVNEALAHVSPGQVEKIELYNPTGQAVNIGGWFLSDDRSVPFKAKIPGGTTINAGAYLQFDSDFFNSSPGSIGATALPGFLLSSHGEDVFLFSSDGSDNLTGYAHGWGFGGSENGVSFGREVSTDGREHFVAQTSQTFGSVNAGPAVGPLVISKVHYHPLSNGVEFVEVTNISGSTVNLYDDTAETESDPTNTYKISGIGFEFPASQSIAAGATVLIVNTDTTLYTTRFGAPGVAVYGPFGNDPDASSDSLSNTGETLHILWPDVPDEVSPAVFEAAYISMDKVRYNDAAPWPLPPDGTGTSLDRNVDANFGSEPTNWASVSPVHQPDAQVDDLIFSQARGMYDTNFNLALTTAGGTADIYYTEDGSVPTSGSTLYTGTISITTSKPIRATAIESGFIDAPVETHTYLMHLPANQKAVRAIAIVGDEQTSLYNPTGVMAINNGAYFPALFDTLEWGPYTYDLGEAALDNPNTGPVDTWLDPLGNPVRPLVGATGNPYNNPKSGATVDGSAYSNPISTGKIMERSASMEMLYPGNSSVGLQENGGIRVAGSDFHRPRYAAHGDGSGDWTTSTLTGIPEATLASYLKFSLRMYFRSEYGPSKLKWPIFPGDPLENYDKVVLRGGHNDGQTPFIKDELTRRLFLDMGQIGVQGTLVNLFINGEYKGWYNPCERLDAKFFQSRFGGSADYDILIQTADLGGEIFDGFDGLPYEPQVKEGDDVAFQALINAAKSSAATPHPLKYLQLNGMLDVPQFIDYLLVQLYSGNDDWPNNNWTAARERIPGSKFKFFVWDAEGTYLSTNLNRNGLDHFPFWNPVRKSLPGGNGAGLEGEYTPLSEIYRGLIVYQEFKDAFSARAVEVLNPTTGALGTTNVIARHNELKADMEALLPGSIPYNNHIATTWIPNRSAYLIGVLQGKGLYP